MTTPSQPAEGRAIDVRCPGCGAMTLYSASNQYRPFCSARCQGHDFGAWANEAYRVEAKPSVEDIDD